MSKKNKLIKIGITALAVLVVLYFVGCMLLSAAIRKGVETFMPKITGTPVKMEKLSFSPLNGHVYIRNFVISNPQGYTTPDAFRLGEMDVKVRPLSLLTDKIEIDYILIRGAEVTYETGLSSSNITDIKANVKKFTGDKKPEEKPEPAAKKSGKKLVIGKFDMEDTKMRGALNSELLKKIGANQVTVPVPGVHLKDIGKEDNASMETTIDKVFGSVFDVVDKTAASAWNVGGQVIEGVKEKGKELIDGVKNIFK